AYAGKGKFAVAPLHLSHRVEEMAHLLAVSISKKVALRYRFVPDMPAIEADAAQVRQVVMNLITNASDAIGDDSGAITIATGVVRADSAYLRDSLLGTLLPLLLGSQHWFQRLRCGCRGCCGRR
ncbi:MAG: hypothetical protein ACREVM_05000, partial [Burkholderiales bacterium]